MFLNALALPNHGIISKFSRMSKSIFIHISPNEKESCRYFILVQNRRFASQIHASPLSTHVCISLLSEFKLFLRTSNNQYILFYSGWYYKKNNMWKHCKSKMSFPPSPFSSSLIMKDISLVSNLMFQNLWTILTFDLFVCYKSRQLEQTQDMVWIITKNW